MTKVLDGRYSETNLKQLFSAILDCDINMIGDLLRDDPSLVSTPYKVKYKRYSKLAERYYTVINDMLPKEYASITGCESVIPLLESYMIDGKSNRTKRTKRSKRSKRTKRSKRSRR